MWCRIQREREARHTQDKWITIQVSEKKRVRLKRLNLIVLLILLLSHLEIRKLEKYL